MSIRYDTDANGVARLTLQRASAANSVTLEMSGQITAALRRFAESDARVLVVTGEGSKSFCAGGAIETLERCADHDDAARVGPLGFAQVATGKPTIAAINGHCFGGGLELALWCDVRIAAANASFGALNRPWGVPLIDGGTQRLPRVVGYGNAMWMILGGERITAERALQMGLVQEVVAEGEALARAVNFAEKVASYPQRALLADHAGVVDTAGLPLTDGLRAEFVRGAPIIKDPDVIDRIRATRAK